jgi:hypothetical protein
LEKEPYASRCKSLEPKQQQQQQQQQHCSDTSPQKYPAQPQYTQKQQKQQKQQEQSPVKIYINFCYLQFPSFLKARTEQV